MIRNMYLLEAVEDKGVKVDAIVAQIRKQMNTCKLTKYRSVDSCSRFYSSFFLSALEDDIHPTIEQWGNIYNTLLSNEPFCADLALYMIMYQPAIYDGLFMSLWNLIQSELSVLRENRVRYLSMTRAMLSFMQMRLDGVGNLIKVQNNDSNVIKFVTVVNQTLTKMCYDLSILTQVEVAKAVKPDDVAFVNTAYVSMEESVAAIPLSEDFAELLWALEESAKIGATETELNEGIVRNAAMKAKELLIQKKKAERDFDEFVMKKVKKIREERRNRKHSEMVGESLRVNHEIKRLLRTGAIYLLSPAWAAISFIISVVYDRQTDKRDRQVLVNQLKDELEIVEEKIQMADKNGDDKARIELIRFRQKLQREYERINRMRWDSSVRNRMSS